MKRRAVDLADGPQHGRRQPQTSCDSCRRRKLKCDRGEPCSSCVTRGLPCHGQPNAKGPAMDQSPVPSATDSILRRLHALEQVVFANRRDERVFRAKSPEGSAANTPRPPAGAEDDVEDDQRTPEAMMRPGRPGSLKFRIRPNPPKDPFPFAENPELTQGCVWMMPRAQATALLQDYLNHVYPLLPVIHGPTTRDLIRKFYDGISRREQLPPHTAALVLGMGAVSAYLWQPDAGHLSRFACAKDAAEASLVWRDWASDILATAATQGPGASTLEEVQAWTLLSFMVQNVEGCSYRFRIFHNQSLTAARELKLHLVDSPRYGRSDDCVTREIKRRIWWHIAATDWLLGFMGGPTEGTYSVQPRHMNVKHPRNLNDNDIMTFDDSTNSPVNHSTQMSYFLQRIRIGEIIRAVLDASHPGSPDGDIADYEQVLTLDRLFEQAFLDLPPFFQGQRPLPPQKLDTLELQRVIIQLGLLSRRARLHRPFLLQQRGYEPRHHRSREICLQSTRAVVALSINIIQCSLNLDRGGPTPFTRRYPGAAETSDTGKGLSAHRLGLVINHLSTACTVLALYTGSFSSSSSSNPGMARGREGSATDKLEWAEVSEELAQACRVLGALEAESPVAADMLRNLVALLKRYRVQGAGVDNDDLPKQAVAAEVTTAAAAAAAAHEQTQWVAVDEMAGAPRFAEPVPLVDERVAVAVVPDDSSVNLDGLWDDFVMDSCHSYDQLFADLDYYCGIGY